jgi:hypothetical protein
MVFVVRYSEIENFAPICFLLVLFFFLGDDDGGGGGRRGAGDERRSKLIEIFL